MRQLALLPLLALACASAPERTPPPYARTAPPPAEVLRFSDNPMIPEGADVRWISKRGEDVPSLEAFAVEGKVTLFDFYADWCAPCRDVDAHVFRLLERGAPIAVRKVNVSSWETPAAERHLADVAQLPYVIVYDVSGKQIAKISGLDLAALDRAIEQGQR